HLRRLVAEDLDGHADAAHVAVAVLLQRALADQELLHGWIGDPADLSRARAMEEPEPPAQHGSFVTRARRTLPKRARGCSASDSPFDQLAEQRPVTARVVRARRGTEYGDRLTRAHPLREGFDQGPLLPHLLQIAGPVLRPGDGWAGLAVHCRVKLAAGAQIRIPFVPRLVRFAHPAGPVAADEES